MSNLHATHTHTKLQVMRPHNAVIEGRKNASFTGIERVESSNDKAISFISSLGKVIIEGSELHIKKFAQEDGVLNIEGEIKSIKYFDSGDKKGFAKKLFR